MSWASPEGGGGVLSARADWRDAETANGAAAAAARNVLRLKDILISPGTWVK
jgi:hypothetical protein